MKTSQNKSDLPGSQVTAKDSVLSATLFGMTQNLSKGDDPFADVPSSVVVDLAVAPAEQSLLRPELEALGFRETGSFGAMMSGIIPAEGLAKLDLIPGIRGASLALSARQADEAISQGDAALGADIARDQFEIDGTGVAVGIISDSFDSGDVLGSLEEDIALGELPIGTEILLDSAFGTDEGRALAQIIHDVAPGSDILFHTGDFGQAGFAQGIGNLASNDADVIVDDLIYLREPFFMDGVIAQSITEVGRQGVSYFSAAGNSADQAYDAEFNGIAFAQTFLGLDFDTFHDFDESDNIDLTQSVFIGQGDTINISLQWDEPFFTATNGLAGSASDVDIFLIDENGEVVAFAIDNNIDQDAVELLQFVNNTDSEFFELMIGLFDGPAPNLIKYVEFDGSALFLEHFQGSGTAIGHAGVDQSVSVGASFYENTPNFGSDPAILNDFSANGASTPLIFDTSGERLDQPIFRQVVDVVGPDGGDNSFFGGIDIEGNGLPNFFGTSASAPHLAAVAALMLEQNPDLLPQDIQDLMQSTALDMDDPFTIGFDEGIDPSTGAGFVDALAAIDAAQGVARKTIAEFGITTISSESQTITLDHAFSNPVVIIGPPSSAGIDPGNVRVSRVEGDRFDIRFDEPNYQDGFHTNEEVSYLVVEAGRWTLPDGSVIEAGTIESNLLTSQGFEQVAFSQSFDETPVLLSQIQTERGGDFAVTRLRAADENGFEIAMQEEEALNSGTHVSERLGFLAVEGGVLEVHGTSVVAGSQSGIGSDGGDLDFGPGLASAQPLLFASIASFNGDNTATLRTEGVDQNGARIVVEEEKSADAEIAHVNELIDFLAFEGAGKIIIDDPMMIVV